MTMVVFDNTILEINGAGPGGIWRNDNCGQHVQAPPRLIKHQPTPPQKKRRGCFTKLRRALKNFTPEQATAWQIYANNHPKQNKKGETIISAWWAKFISYNINKCVADTPISLWPPT